MQDKMTFQPEAFPLEVLGSEEVRATVFEDGRARGRALPRWSWRRFPSGFLSAPACAGATAPTSSEARPPQRPGSLYPPPRRRWPTVPWPIGGGLTIAEPQCPEPPPCVCPPATDAAAAEPDTSAPA